MQINGRNRSGATSVARLLWSGPLDSGTLTKPMELMSLWIPSQGMHSGLRPMLSLGSVLLGEMDAADLYGWVQAIGSPHTDGSSIFDNYSTFKNPIGHPHVGSLLVACTAAHYLI